VSSNLEWLNDCCHPDQDYCSAITNY
jgi:hypothetical protein